MSAVNFSVTRASSKYVLNESGVIEEVLANTPAFEYNTNGTYKGLLVESASENICLQSEDITTTWTSTNATITTNATTAPDGAATADKLNDDNGGGTGAVFVKQTFNPVTAEGQYTASVFLKADQLNYARLTAVDYDSTTDAYQWFELTGAGSTGIAANLDSSKIEQYPNGWYRCSITWTQGVGDTDVDFRVEVSDSLNSFSVVRDGTSSIFVWGAQVEEGGHASSYIPTTTTSVTRAKDDISLLSASTYIGQTAGTVYLEATIDNIVPSTSLISASDGSSSDIVKIEVNSSSQFRMYVFASSSTIINDVETTTATSGTYKFAIVYSSGDTRVYRNGVQLSNSATALTFGATVDEIDIGQSFAATGQADNWIKAFAFYKRALTDTEAITLTT